MNVTSSVNVNAICDCPCEQNKIEADPNCNGSPSQCGLCNCDNQHNGHNCTCDAPKAPQNFCQIKGEKRCNQCFCGKCDCFEDFFGDTCSCKKKDCLGKNRLMCSGNGVCKCRMDNMGYKAECECNKGWTHDKCDCDVNTDACKGNGIEEECSGHGKCKCNKCQCEKRHSYFKYNGTHCEHCLNCEEFGQVLVTFFRCELKNNKGINVTKCKQHSDVLQFTQIDKEIKGNQQDRVYTSSYINPDSGCKQPFHYKITNKAILYSLEKPDCEENDMFSILVVVVTSVIIIGVGTLLVWKVITVVHDRKEFGKFKKEIGSAKWSEATNPLYKPATTAFSNPVFENTLPRDASFTTSPSKMASVETKN